MRKGLWIRLLIYIPLLSYFGWAAYKKWSAPPPEVPADEGRRHMFTLPDGKSVEVVEISEDQARAMGLDPDAARAGGGEAPPKAPPTEEKKTAPAPSGGAN